MKRKYSKPNLGDYRVGYGRPPREHRFKKGEPSPHPQGRPRGSRSPDLGRVLLEPVSIKVQGRSRRVPYLEAWAQVLKEKAIKGDIKASQVLIILARQLGLLKAQELLEDFTFTFDIRKPPPPEGEGV